ncbi:MAG: hypothetical protein DRI84_10005 [Bacteroidetes bacterium]|nr:MAG: hypothetical protein DRI84_10005 [Bacteroidota bacterium]
MIKFFRKIRQRMLTENNFSKYLIYAIGEIILVVIGILIALSINNWNELKKEGVKEQKILASLFQDFKINIKNLDDALKLYPEMQDRSIKVLSLVGLAKDSLKMVEPLSIIKTTYILTEIIDGTLISVLNSDKLELIKNDSIKNLLTSYPASVENFKKREANLEKVILEIQRPIIEEYVSLTDLLPMENLDFESIKSKTVQSNYKGLLNDLRWQNVLMHRYYATQELSKAAIELKKKTVEIYSLLRKDLDTFH